MKKDATLFQITTNNAEATRKIASNSFCLVKEKDNHLSILYYDKQLKRTMVWETSSIVSKEERENNVLLVRTRNSKYFLCRWINNIEEEWLEHYVLNLRMNLRLAKEQVSKDFENFSAVEILKLINVNK